LSPLNALPAVRDLRNLGMVWAFEMAGGADQAREVQRQARDRNLLIRPLGATVYLMPPFMLDGELCDWLGRVLAESVVAAAAVPLECRGRADATDSERGARIA
jgi:adenosylmethionine-8-amino-7-oxononanoate aminotransferase